MNQDLRPDPDALLAQWQQEETAAKSGKLHIFLGMCPGVGKTYAMLQSALQRAAQGVDVLAGLVETHGRAETAALLERLPLLPRQEREYRGSIWEEFDLDAALRLRPQLILVDELAHTNIPGSRHAKRYQDVLELLKAGIDVFTTLNVQHIESQIDIVRQITGVAVRETVPDSILDRAGEIQLIDLSVEKLLARMAEGKVYLGEGADLAAAHFFREGNLTALREMALRFTAEQVDRHLEDLRRARRISSPWKANTRLLVGVGPSPYAESLIRWTRRAASRLGCPWLVVWVEGLGALTAGEQERLTRSLSLARKLGAEVISATGENVAETLLAVARERNVSQIVVGKSGKLRRWHRTLADRIIAGSGDIDVSVVRPLSGAQAGQPRTVREPLPASLVSEYSWVLVSVFTIASLCWAVASLTGYMFAGLVFLLAVVLAALRFRPGPVLTMATLSALCWNYFFIPPQFTLSIQKAEDWAMFVLFFIVALSMGSLTSRLRLKERAERRRLRHTDALLRVTQSAALSVQREDGLAEALRTIDSLLHAESALVLRGADGMLPSAVHRASSFQPSPKEWGVISWVYANKLGAGRFTDTLPESGATWFPLQTATSIMGVLGLQLPEDAQLDFNTRQTVEALVLQLALALEKDHFIQAVNQAEWVAQSEKLHRTLLDSVSHELKTPLSVIRASLDGLSGVDSPYLSEISTATGRLQRVVDGLLQMSRLESEILKPSFDWYDLRDVISAAREAVNSSLEGHPLHISLPGDLPLIKLDHALFAQALANILHNAAIHTPAGTPVEVRAQLDAGALRLQIRDHGPGLPSGTEHRVFEKFYRAQGTPAGGTGLGLAIARGFIQAQGGHIRAGNHPGGGAEFVIELDQVETFVPPGPEAGPDLHPPAP